MGIIKRDEAEEMIDDVEESIGVSGVVRKSNYIINSMTNNSLLSNKVFLASLIKIEDRRENPVTDPNLKSYYDYLYHKTATDFSRGLVAEISNAEFRSMMDNKSGSYYAEIDKLLNGGSFIDNWKIISNDSRIKGVTTLITGCVYDNEKGKLLIKFNADAAYLLIDLKTNYTKLPRVFLMHTKNPYAYRIYEMLRSKMDYSRYETKSEGPYEYVYDVSQFKFLLSVLNPKASEETIKKLTADNPNYTNIEDNILPDDAKKMVRYTDLKRYVLDPSRKEINNRTDIKFDFAPLRSGRGGKVSQIKFTCFRKSQLEAVVKKAPDLFDLIDSVRIFSGDTFSTKDIGAMLAAADNDVTRIKKAYELLKKKTGVRDTTAWMIAAIVQEYKAGKSNVNDGLLTRDYDFDELERKFLVN